MPKFQKIIVFTNSYPYGNGYNWLDGEIALFHKHFKEIVISPYTYEGNMSAKILPDYDNVIIRPPVLDKDIEFTSLWQIRKIISRRSFYYLREFFQERIYSKSYWFKSWVQSILKTEMLLHSDIWKLLHSIAEKEETVLYFYWGNNQTLMVPFLGNVGYRRILVRFHGFDLYKERLGGYQPFRRQLLKSLSVAAPISEFGNNYLKREYTDVQFRCETVRLGVKDVGRSKRSEDGWIRIVSCARVIRLKRVELIARILKNLQIRIEWTHIGDGDYFYLVENEMKDIPEYLKINLVGQLAADDVQLYYKNNPVDIFISLSESEGIPVSIMEAFAAGIPVFSTDVGGIKEIVNEGSGQLINVNLSQKEIENKLLKFMDKYQRTPDKYRVEAYNQFRKYSDLSKCNADILNLLID